MTSDAPFNYFYVAAVIPVSYLPYGDPGNDELVQVDDYQWLEQFADVITYTVYGIRLTGDEPGSFAIGDFNTALAATATAAALAATCRTTWDSRIPTRPDTVFDIPVLFQVRANNEDAAARLLRTVLSDADVISPDWLEENCKNEIESWHLPNHKEIDGSDSPVRVVIIPLISPLRQPA